MTHAVRGFDELTPGELWEWHADLTMVYNLTTGEELPGHRVRYRRQSETRWATFNLTTEDGAAPTETMVIRAIEEHAGLEYRRRL